MMNTALDARVSGDIHDKATAQPAHTARPATLLLTITGLGPYLGRGNPAVGFAGKEVEVKGTEKIRRVIHGWSLLTCQRRGS